MAAYQRLFASRPLPMSSSMCCPTKSVVLLGILALFLSAEASASAIHGHKPSPWAPSLAVSRRLWGTTTGKTHVSRLCTSIRGGSTEAEDEYDEYESEDEEYDSDADVTDGEDESMEGGSDGVQIEMKVEKFDEPLVPSPMISLFASLGVMLLAKRIDLLHPTVVRIARFMFIVYLVSLQAFVLYARMKAKSYNDRTPLTMSSPLSSVLNSQLGDQSGMMKTLASSLLSSESTVVEYDLKQAKSMQSGLLFNMVFMWFLHFKMNQVQPLIIQTVTGFANLIYSPLFQVYVLGRNLERPFKNPAMPKLEASPAEDSPTEIPLTIDTNETKGDAVDASDDEEDDEKESATQETAKVDNSDKVLTTSDSESDSSDEDSDGEE